MAAGVESARYLEDDKCRTTMTCASGLEDPG